MGYFEIIEDLTVGYSIDRYPDLNDEVSFIAGVRQNLPPETELRLGLDCPRDEFPGHYFPGIIPVVSKTFAAMLRAAGIDNFQLYPVVLEGLDGAEWRDDYYAFNVIGVADSLDIAKSNGVEIMPDGDDGSPGVFDFSHPVVDPERAKGLLMFREARMRALLVFHDQLDRFLVALRPSEGWGIRLKYLNESYDPTE